MVFITLFIICTIYIDRSIFDYTFKFFKIYYDLHKCKSKRLIIVDKFL